MTEQRARYLLTAYLQQQLVQDERDELFSWINSAPDPAKMDRALLEVWDNFVSGESMGDTKAQKMLSEILAHKALQPLRQKSAVVRLQWWKLAAAAVILAGVGLISYQRFSAAKPTVAKTEVNLKKDSAVADASPGTVAARLTLGDGSFIALDTLTQNAVALQGNTQIVKHQGRIIYENGKDQNAQPIYNTLSTDRGHQYPLTLSDGTKILLNAASSIHFPVVFTGKQRSVEITGEAYFEVAKNGKPFIVHAAGTSVEVLGTHFNVNSYADETGVNTTLLEGSVKIIRGRAALLLSPGQQAQVSKTGNLVLNRNADTEAAISWTQGYFHFNNASLATVLRQLARWYDVDIVYEKHYPDENYDGDIQKSLRLSQVLKILERSQVSLRIQGKQLIVTK